MTKTTLKERDADGGLFGGEPAKPAPKPAPKGRGGHQPAPGPKPPNPGTSSGVAVALRPPEPPKSMLAVIAAAASNPAVDVAKMKELLAMQREIEQREEVREFNAAMLAAQEAMPRIVRDKDNPHTRAKYPSLENVSKSIDAVARKNGFTMSWGTEDSHLKDHYRIVCDLSHAGGHVRKYRMDLPGDSAGQKGTSNKTLIQGVASSISFARRIIKILMFDLVILGNDKDGKAAKRLTPEEAEGIVVEAAAVITTEQHDKLGDAIEACGVGREKFCQHYGIEKVANLPAERYDEAMNACNNYAANQKAKSHHG